MKSDLIGALGRLVQQDVPEEVLRRQKAEVTFKNEPQAPLVDVCQGSVS
jgi:hypothetical protein